MQRLTDDQITNMRMAAHSLNEAHCLHWLIQCNDLHQVPYLMTSGYGIYSDRIDDILQAVTDSGLYFVVHVGREYSPVLYIEFYTLTSGEQAELDALWAKVDRLGQRAGADERDYTQNSRGHPNTPGFRLWWD